MEPIKYVLNIQSGSIMRRKKLSQFLQAYPHLESLKQAILSSEFEFLDQYYNTLDVQTVWAQLVGETWPNDTQHQAEIVEEGSLPKIPPQNAPVQRVDDRTKEKQKQEEVSKTQPPVQEQEKEAEADDESTEARADSLLMKEKKPFKVRWESQPDKSEKSAEGDVNQRSQSVDGAVTSPKIQLREGEEASPAKPRQKEANKREQVAPLSSVFVTYGQADEETAERMMFALKSLGVSDMIHSGLVQPSDTISSFTMASMLKSEVTFAFVSPESLLAAWVAKDNLEQINEMVAGDASPHKFVVCLLEDKMYETDFYFELMNKLQSRQKKLWKDIGDLVRAGMDAKNMIDEHGQYHYLIIQLEGILAQLKSAENVAIDGGNLYNNLPRLMGVIKGKKTA